MNASTNTNIEIEWRERAKVKPIFFYETHITTLFYGRIVMINYDCELVVIIIIVNELDFVSFVLITYELIEIYHFSNFCGF